MRRKQISLPYDILIRVNLLANLGTSTWMFIAVTDLRNQYVTYISLDDQAQTYQVKKKEMGQMKSVAMA